MRYRVSYNGNVFDVSACQKYLYLMEQEPNAEIYVNKLSKNGDITEGISHINGVYVYQGYNKTNTDLMRWFTAHTTYINPYRCIIYYKNQQGKECPLELRNTAGNSTFFKAIDDMLIQLIKNGMLLQDLYMLGVDDEIYHIIGIGKLQHVHIRHNIDNGVSLIYSDMCYRKLREKVMKGEI